MDEVIFDDHALTVIKDGQANYLAWNSITWVCRTVIENLAKPKFYLLLYNADNNYIEINDEMKGWGNFVGVLSYRVGGTKLSQMLQSEEGFFCSVR